MKNLLNVASWDRITRALIGLVLMYVGFSGVVTGLWGTAIGLIGLIPLVTGLIGFCPLYFVFKVNTLWK